MNAEIIAIGSELLLGQIANTNAQFLSKKLADIGVNVFYHQVVGDNAERLEKVIADAQKRSQLIVFTGGLGPTKDDLTKETIAAVLNKKLIIDENALDGIKKYFQKVNRVMTDNNIKQAEVIEGATVFPNDNGMAPGMGVKQNDITYMLFPGPPKELYPMVNTYAIPFLQKQLGQETIIYSKALRFFGIGEAQLETELEELIEKQTNPTIAPLAGDGEVMIRITAKDKSSDGAQRLIAHVEKEIIAKVGEFIYGTNETSLPEVVVSKLQEKNMTVAAAESLTGGLFSKELTNISGVSNVFQGSIVCYANEVKRDILQVPSNILNDEGAVSEKCAAIMAERVKALCHSNIGISFTGVAGPNTIENKPVGKLFIGLAMENKETKVFELQLAGDRNSIRMRAMKYGFYYLLKYLQS